MQVFVALLLDPNINIRCKAAGALQSLAVHPSNQQAIKGSGAVRLLVNMMCSKEGMESSAAAGASALLQLLPVVHPSPLLYTPAP